MEPCPHNIQGDLNTLSTSYYLSFKIAYISMKIMQSANFYGKMSFIYESTYINCS